MNTGSSVRPQAGLSASCEIRIDNNLSKITRVADMVNDFAARHRFPDQVLFALNVVLDEIVNDIISYGYKDAGHHNRSTRLLTSRRRRSGCGGRRQAVDPLAAPAPDLTSAHANPAAWACILCAI